MSRSEVELSKKPKIKPFTREQLVRRWVHEVTASANKTVEQRNKIVFKNPNNKQKDGKKETRKTEPFKELTKKTVLHKKHIMDWLARYKGKVNEEYLFLPAQKVKRNEFSA
jgi:hypothetical protein